MQLYHRRGNVLDSDPSLPILHCISHDARLGAGVARELNQKLNFRNQILAVQRSMPGLVVTYGQRTVLNLLTKWRYFDKPTLNNFKQALLALRNFVLLHNVQEIATVRLGTGLDRLALDDVLEALATIFYDVNVRVYMYYLD